MTPARTVAAPTGEAQGMAPACVGAGARAVRLRLPGAWVMVGGFCVIDVVWGGHIGLAIDGWPLAVGLTALLLAASAAYRRRSPSIAAMIGTAALWVAFTPSACVLTYLAATCAAPLRDAWLAHLDQGLGFDWLAWRDSVFARPLLHAVLSLAYMSLLPQMVLSTLFLATPGHRGRSGELVMLAALTLLPTIVIGALCPALGPLAGHGAESTAFLPDLLALRAGGPWHFELPALQGIIAMPSYHVVLAVLFTYAFRGTGAVGWGIAALNVLMLPAIPPIGGHYLADMIAGGAIAGLSIAGLRWWRRARRATTSTS